MKILLIGATGTIGAAIAQAFRGNGHELVEASRRKAANTVDIATASSLQALFKKTGRVDAIVCAAGSAAWKPLAELSDEDFQFSLANKLMGQVNVIRLGREHLNDGGSITVTSGVLAHNPMQGSAAVSLVNSGLEGFVRAAALESQRGVRVNCVSPPWVSETLTAMGQDPSHGLPAAAVAKSYVHAVESTETGKILSPKA